MASGSLPGMAHNGGRSLMEPSDDVRLLDRYFCDHDEQAFSELMRIHGPMVWGVCRRMLFNHQDAEDAFQASFMVLERKGHSLKDKTKLSNWLYGVAQQTALKARLGRRQAKFAGTAGCRRTRADSRVIGRA